MKIEMDQEKEIYRLSDGDDESPDYIAGALVDFGELAWLEKDGEHFFAFIDSDGETDGRVYMQSSGSQVEVEPDCEFEDDEAAAG
jgi:hypothetical protein